MPRVARHNPSYRDVKKRDFAGHSFYRPRKRGKVSQVAEEKTGKTKGVW